MNRLTASLTGDYTDNSNRLRKDSDNLIQLQINYHQEITEIEYTIHSCPEITKTLSSGQITQEDSINEPLIYTVKLLELDGLKNGYYRNTVKITTADGNFEMSLDKGRVRVEQ